MTIPTIPLINITPLFGTNATASAQIDSLIQTAAREHGVR